jgi:gliding motility-associated-like protein
MYSSSKIFSFFVLLFFLSLIDVTAQVNLNSGLVGYFPFDGNSNDQSSNAINGVINNATLITGKNNNINEAYLFNGVNANIDCSNNNRNTSDVVTISVWVNTTMSTIGWVVGKYDWQVDRGFAIQIKNGRPFLSGRNGSGQYSSTYHINTPIVNDGNWHHLLAIVNGNSWTMYVDCQYGTTITSNSTNPLLLNQQPLAIGYYPLGSGTFNYNFFAGSIDDVRIYNRVLTPAEVQTLCDINFISMQPPLVSNDTTVCEDTLYTLTAIPDTGQVVWESPIGNQVGIGNSLTISSNQNQTFYAYSVLNGYASDTSTIEVTVQNCGIFQAPIVSNDTTVCMDTIFTMTASADSGLIQWESPLGVNIGIGNSLSTSFNQNTTVYVYSISNMYYSDTSQIKIVVKSCKEIVFPNIFTPNGDGVNDYFVFDIPNLTCFKCDVFNRWGILVHTFSNANIGWDGYIPEAGKRSPDGIYFYVISYCVDEIEYRRKGSVTILR